MTHKSSVTVSHESMPKDKMVFCLSANRILTELIVRYIPVIPQILLFFCETYTYQPWCVRNFLTESLVVIITLNIRILLGQLMKFQPFTFLLWEVVYWMDSWR